MGKISRGIGIAVMIILFLFLFLIDVGMVFVGWIPVVGDLLAASYDFFMDIVTLIFYLIFGYWSLHPARG